MVDFRNGMRDPYGIMPPDPDQDTYGATQPRPQAGWVAGGQTPTNSATPMQAQYIQKPNGSDYPPPSVQSNQPLPTTPSRPELKVPSTADYIFEGLANALRGRASGAVFGALAAKWRHAQAQNSLAEKQYEFDTQDQERRARLAVPSKDELRQREKKQILATPGLRETRIKSGLDPDNMTDSELDSGIAEQHALSQDKGHAGARFEAVQAHRSIVRERDDAAEQRNRERIDAANERAANREDTGGRAEVAYERQWLKDNPGKFHLDYVRAKAQAAGEGRVDSKPDKPSDREVARQGMLRRGELSGLKRFDEQNTASDQAASQLAAQAKGGPLAQGPGKQPHPPLNTQSGQTPTQSGQALEMKDGTHWQKVNGEWKQVK